MGHFFDPPGGQNKNVIPPGPSPTDKAKGLLPGTTADAAARSGGGISPQFIQGLLGQQVGSNPADLDVLSQIRQSLNTGGGGA